MFSISTTSIIYELNIYITPKLSPAITNNFDINNTSLITI